MSQRVLDNGRYKVLRRLGGGTYAEVVEVFDVEKQCRFAAKILRIDGAQAHITRAMFLREQRALEGFEHASVVQLVRWFGDERELVLILELVPGGRTAADLLADVALRRVDRPTLRWRTTQLVAVAEALLAAHGRNVVHRDIKLGNLLQSSEEDALKLADFGISLVLELTAQAPAGTTLREFHSRPWAAPEQLLQREVSFAADVHAFGLVAASLLALHLPDDDFDPSRIDELLVEVDAELTDSGLSSEVWANARALLARCTEAEASSRPRLADLHRALVALNASLAPAVQAGLQFTRTARAKLVEAGFADERALLVDLNDGLRICRLKGEASQIRIKCLGKSGFCVAVQEASGTLSVVDAGRNAPLLHDRFRREATPSSILLCTGIASGDPLVEEAYKAQTQAMEAATELLLDTAEKVNKLELERLAVLRVEYELHDGQTHSTPFDEARQSAAGLTSPIEERVPCKGTVRLVVRSVTPWPRNGRRSIVTQHVDRTIGRDDGDDEEVELGDEPIEGWHRLYDDPRKVTALLPRSDGRCTEIGTYRYFDEGNGILTIELPKKVVLPRTGILQLKDKQAEVVLSRLRDTLNAVRRGETLRTDLLRLLSEERAHTMGEQSYCTLLQRGLGPAPELAHLVERSMACEGIFSVQGPPGAGKTTFVGEVVAQVLEIHPTWRIAVVSQANEAVANVLERLREIRRDLGRPWLLCRDVRDEVADQENDQEKARLTADGRHPTDLLPEEWKVAGADHAYTAFAIEVDRRSRVNARAAQVSPAVDDALELWRSDLRAGAGGTMDDWRELVQVWGVTLVRSASVLNRLERKSFDLVIIDEAGKATVAETLVPMVAGRRFLLVGDHKQLPPYLDSLTESQLRQLGLDSSQAKRSLFEHLLGVVPAQMRGMLRTQYRMHRTIGDFVSHLFYREEGGVRTGVPDDKREMVPGIFDRPHRVLHVNVEGVEESVGTSKRNLREIEAILRILRRLDVDTAAAGTTYEVAVMSAYKPQVQQIGRRLTAMRFKALTVKAATVDSFQGRQADVVIYSTVRTARSEWAFVGDEKRLNVSLSRAKRLLVLVGDAASARCTPILRTAFDLIPEENFIREEDFR